MDIERGGMEPDAAFSCRGFHKTETGYMYGRLYEVDSLSKKKEEFPIEKQLTIPSKVGGIPITCIYEHAN